MTLWIVSTIAAVALLFSYRTSLGGGSAAAGAPAVVATGDATGPSASGPPGASLTVNGAVARTRYGPIQVQIKIQNHKIIDVRALRYPDGNDRDVEINSYALPQLRAEVLAAQSAQVDTVGGATYTSGGYLKSLQSALDAAHFA
ncbi:FMN-binding protein [Actinoplanes sp. KI2]|uniref:FMN-binding protein n=1 Tax=Actinoplanes sp. KI2 TaxID=2983315 RepID=UPI00294FFDD9|nr:FMN-binding protein [Actinoplanes sp. KI2]